MGDLTKNFSKREFACHCGCGKTLSSGAAPIVVALQKLRERARMPVVVVSGVRCARHNRAVGGARYSQHLAGNAADIFVPGMRQADLLALIESMPEFKGIGIEWRGRVRYIHVDCRSKKARWSYGGKTFYQAKEVIKNGP